MLSISCGLCCEGNDLFVFCEEKNYRAVIYNHFKKPISDLFRYVKEGHFVDKLNIININAEFNVRMHTLTIHNVYINEDLANPELLTHIEQMLKV